MSAPNKRLCLCVLRSGNFHKSSPSIIIGKGHKLHQWECSTRTIVKRECQLSCQLLLSKAGVFLYTRLNFQCSKGCWGCLLFSLNGTETRRRERRKSSVWLALRRSSRAVPRNVYLLGLSQTLWLSVGLCEECVPAFKRNCECLDSLCSVFTFLGSFCVRVLELSPNGSICVPSVVICVGNLWLSLDEFGRSPFQLYVSKGATHLLLLRLRGD